MAGDTVFQRCSQRRRERALGDIVAKFKRRRRRLADLKAWGCRDRWEKPLKPLAAAGEFGRDDGGLGVSGLSNS